jgi:Rrf2 family protein
MLSMKAKYALKALANLARAPEGHSVLISDLARDEQIPKRFLELILVELKQHGLCPSKKGRGGGYALGKSAREISLVSVIRIIDGPIALLPCVSEIAHRRCEGCRDERTCGLRYAMQDVHAATLHALRRRTGADIAQVPS